MGKKLGRNEPCPCGSGKKYKKCHQLLKGRQKAITQQKMRESTREPKAAAVEKETKSTLADLGLSVSENEDD